MTKKPLNYSDYLKLEDILNSQELKSAERGTPAHDEMLFIIIHQVYELWFKQVIHELNSVLDIFGKRSVVESDVSLAVARLDRIIEIQKILIDQVRVLETMTAMDFLEFRDDLFPSSGFQSAQFRLLENKLGLPKRNRISYGKEDYKTAIINKEKEQVERSEMERSLFELLEKESIKLSIKNLYTYPFIKKLIDIKSLEVHGLWYDIAKCKLFYLNIPSM